MRGVDWLKASERREKKKKWRIESERCGGKEEKNGSRKEEVRFCPDLVGLAAKGREEASVSYFFIASGGYSGAGTWLFKNGLPVVRMKRCLM